MLVIGLTGGIACGKSTVSKRFREKHKIPVIDADLIAREIMAPGESAYYKVVEEFSSKVPNLLLPNGELNRPVLGDWIFANPKERKTLNAIAHPEVRRKILFQIVGYYLRMYPMCVLDVPLLFESGMDVFCGITISVICNKEVQIERLMLRNPDLTKEQALDRINSQISMQERIEKSNFIIENNDNLETLYLKIDNVVSYMKPFILTVILHYFIPFGIISALSLILSKWYTRYCAKKIRQRKQVRKVVYPKKFRPANIKVKHKKGTSRR
ncbi:HEL168Wp [Eremothecium sinecaudum]|uniref:HEL168Wp n=1 Tax=Eremothecium sinecaudum TaxID=45286 RepID=A0A0X8HTH0_9SACH|nr:HEL168Wp [Eremothecium sinecaudum]AMD21113.1 HEL168Wp [Eremothecium sinecaudum]